MVERDEQMAGEDMKMRDIIYYITYLMEESIYQIIPAEKAKPQKAKMYHSQFPGVIDPTGSTFNNKTTGSPGVWMGWGGEDGRSTT